MKNELFCVFWDSARGISYSNYSRQYHCDLIFVCLDSLAGLIARSVEEGAGLPFPS